MKKIVILLMLLTFIGCQNVSDILPESRFRYLEKYHCWPYKVKVYSIDKIKIDSIFFSYPLKSYYGNNRKYKISTWAKYKSSEIDTSLWYGMDKTLEQCDNNTELYNQVSKGGEIYYAGSYQYIKNKQGEERKEYENILILDLLNCKMHIFKNINKMY